jgi:hypothetical protein
MKSTDSGFVTSCAKQKRMPAWSLGPRPWTGRGPLEWFEAPVKDGPTSVLRDSRETSKRAPELARIERHMDRQTIEHPLGCIVVETMAHELRNVPPLVPVS